MDPRISSDGQSGGVNFAGGEYAILGDVVGRDKIVGLDEAKTTELFRRMLWSVQGGKLSEHHRAAVALQSLLAERTAGFVGRRFLFDAIDRFCSDTTRGYFIIRGVAGIGKTSFAAELVRTRGLVHHFNIRQEGGKGTQAFIENVCGQLIARHQLPIESIPQDAARDATFFKYVLELCSAKLRAGERIAIVIDALDEADAPPPGVNPLNLPTLLPAACFIIVTTRPRKDAKAPRVSIECEQETLLLEAEGKANKSDIRDFLRQQLPRPKIQDYIRNKRTTDDEFLAELEKASEGNFMYLRYVLPEVEAGRYNDNGSNPLPVGLADYYEQHWALMRGASGDEWYDLKLPVIAAVTVVHEPVSIGLIAEISNIASRARIRDVLREWAAFLEERSDSSAEPRYRIYHASFHEFLAERPEVAELNRIEDRIIDMGLDLYGGDQQQAAAPAAPGE